MQESDRGEVTLSGVEADLVASALDHHEPDAPEDVDRVGDLESLFETDLDATADGRFELSRADARVVVSAIAAHEPLVDEPSEERLEELQEKFRDEFDLERQPEATDPVDEEEEEFPGST